MKRYCAEMTSEMNDLVSFGDYTFRVVGVGPSLIYELVTPHEIVQLSNETVQRISNWFQKYTETK